MNEDVWTFMIHNELEWIKDAPAPTSNPVLEERLRLAVNTFNPQKTLGTARKTLAKSGIAVVADPSTSSEQLAAYVGLKLLEHRCCLSIENANNIGILQIQTHETIILTRVAKSLKVNIYLFSATKKTRVYEAPDAKGAIGLLHMADSMRKTTKFFVLATGTMEPGHFITPPTLPPPLPLLPVAVLRADGRKRKRPSTAVVDMDECQNAFKQACIESIQQGMSGVVSKIIKKKRLPKGTTRTDFIQGECERMRKKLESKDRLPSGVLKATLASLQQKHPEFTMMQLSWQLGPGSNNLEAYQDAVSSNFESIWDSSLATTEAGLDKTENSSSSSSSSRPAEETSTDHRDDSERSKDEYRCCTVTLKQIVRPELSATRISASELSALGFSVEEQTNGGSAGSMLQGPYGVLCEMLKKSQVAITRVMQDYSALALKTVHILAKGEVYDAIGFEKERIQSFDISKAFPPGFSFRDNAINPIIEISPVPSGLQDHILTHMEQRLGVADDVVDVLGQSCMSFLGARLMGSGGTQRADGKHQLWTRLLNVIREESDTSNLKPLPGGLSTTFSIALRQFCTAIKNISEGPAYRKLLDYTIRVLLRIRLAGRREMALRLRTKAFVEKKRKEKQERQAIMSTQECRRARKAKISQLLSELEDAVLKQKPWHAQTVLQKLYQLAIEEPSQQPTHNPIPSLYDQLAQTNIQSCGDSALTGLSSSLFAVQDLDLLDEIEERMEEEDENSQAKAGSDDGQPTESSRSTLKALQTVIMILLESPYINKPVDKRWIKRSAHKGKDFTDEELQVAADLTNLFRPFVAKRIPKDSSTLDSASDDFNLNSSHRKTKPSVAHVALRSPFFLIANQVLRAAGYHQFTQIISPEISPSAFHAVSLTPATIFEIFSGQGDNIGFDVMDSRGDPITSTARALEESESVFSSFFNVSTIQTICRAHGLKFDDRIMFVNPLTVRIQGKVVQHGLERPGYPVRSQWEASKKRGAPDPFSWEKEAAMTKCTKEELEAKVEDAAKRLKEIEVKVRSVRTELNEVENARMEAGHAHRRMEIDKKRNRDTTSEAEVDLKKSYKALQTARQEVAIVRVKARSMEANLRSARSDLFYWNKVWKAADPAYDPSKNTDNNIGDVFTEPDEVEIGTPTARRTKPGPSHYHMEDHVRNVDISNFFYNSRGQERNVAIAGTDYGIRTFSETMPMTLSDVQVHMNRFQALSVKDQKPPDTPPPVVNKALTKLGASHPITAQHINDISHTTRSMRNRERRLKSNKKAQDDLNTLSTKELLFSRASTLEDIDQVHAARMCAGGDLREFQHSRQILKDSRNRELRGKRAWTVLGSDERHYVRQHFKEGSDQAAMPLILFIGLAGTGVGSRIGGHARRGGKVMRHDHQQHCFVALTDEYNTSQRCLFCFDQMRTVKYRRILSGEVKLVKVNGAKECTNPSCPSVTNGHAIRSRDAHSALCIALAGASTVLNGEPIDPFNRRKALRPTSTTSNTLDEPNAMNISSRYNHGACTEGRLLY